MNHSNKYAYAPAESRQLHENGVRLEIVWDLQSSDYYIFDDEFPTYNIEVQNNDEYIFIFIENSEWTYKCLTIRRETGDLQGALFDPKEREELPLEVVEDIIAFVEEQVEARLKRGTYFIEAPWRVGGGKTNE